MEDELRSVYSLNFDYEVLKLPVGSNLWQSTWELAKMLNISQSTICRYIEKIWKVGKLNVLFLHILSEKKVNHLLIVTSFLLQQRNNLLLKYITGDEKLLTYTSIQCKRLWIDKDKSPQPTPKAELHG